MIQRPKQIDNLSCLRGNNADGQYSDPVTSGLHLLLIKKAKGVVILYDHLPDSKLSRRVPRILWRVLKSSAGRKSLSESLRKSLRESYRERDHGGPRGGLQKEFLRASAFLKRRSHFCKKILTLQMYTIL